MIISSANYVYGVDSGGDETYEKATTSTTVYEFTNKRHRTLYTGVVDDSIKEIWDALSFSINKADYPNISDTEYNASLEQAVYDFQKANNLSATGKINDETLQKILANVNGDTIYYETTESEAGTDDGVDGSTDPHYNSFFDIENEKTLRRNTQDIKIVLGENNIVKTLHNVYMRSVSTEYDTSGNPISETYEFIAQDLTESDNSNDIKKY